MNSATDLRRWCHISLCSTLESSFSVLTAQNSLEINNIFHCYKALSLLEVNLL